MRQGMLNSHFATLQMTDLLPQRFRSGLLRRAGVVAGEGCFIKAGLRITHPGHVRLGGRVFINFDVFIDSTGPVTIGDGADIGDHVRLLTSTHEIGPAEKRGGPVQARPVTVGGGVWLGSGVTVLPGVTIERGCVIGAGSVVTRDCTADGLYVGAPARRIRDL